MREVLTRQECSAMRGIAILAIMLHNYSHWLKGIVRENEYIWSAAKTDQFWAILQNPDELLPCICSPSLGTMVCLCSCS